MQDPGVQRMRIPTDQSICAWPKVILCIWAVIFFYTGKSKIRCGCQIQRQMANGTGLTVSEIKELLATSRKFAVPICEYLDRIGFTRREGDLRMLR